jgi:hypothetical protein
MSGWAYGTAVYCFGEGPGQPVKLGVSECIVNRFQMIRTHTWREMRSYWAWWGDETHERALKDRFADRRIRNEWFADPDDAIKNLMPWNLPKDGISWPIKMDVQKALRLRRKEFSGSFPGIRPSYSLTHEKQFRHFDASLQREITEYVGGLGIALTDADFAPRDGRELEAAILQVTA